MRFAEEIILNKEWGWVKLIKSFIYIYNIVYVIFNP